MPDPTAPDAADEVLPRPFGHLISVDVGDDRVVYDPMHRVAHRLNPSAATVLDRCDGTTPTSDLADELATRHGAERATVARDVQAALADFRARSLVSDPADPVSPTELPAPWGALPQPTAPVDPGAVPTEWAAVSPVLRLLDLRVRVRTDDPVIGDYVAETFASLVEVRSDDEPGRSDDGSVATIDVIASGIPVRILLDGVDVGRGRDRDAAMAFLQWRLNQMAIRATTTSALLHASAVRRPDGVAAFPAISNSGKSTLAAGLVRAGFGYVTDEAVAVDLVTGSVHPFPKPIGLDPGSWSLFQAEAPSFAGSPGTFFRNEWHVDPRVLHPAALDGVDLDQQITLVAFPRYEAGAATNAEPLSPGEALLGLIGNAFNLAAVGAPAIEALASVARRAMAVRLTIGDLDDAIDLVRRLGTGLT